MYIIKSDSTDAYFNLAIEEYLINKYDDDFFVFAVNEPSIIVGRNQNTYDEVNAIYVKQNSLKVIRRLTGGGAVFQDSGNINFSKIYKDDGSRLGDFSTVSDIIVKFFKETYNLNVEFAGRNDILIEDKKFSGHARTRMNNKLLHHGTLLFSSNMNFLIDALKVNPNKRTDRTLRSTHDRVTNISEHLSEEITVERFREQLIKYVRSVYPESAPMELSQEDIDGIQKLVDEKYATFEWNYGEQINFNFRNSLSTNKGNIDVFLKIDDNLIKEARFCGDFFSQKEVSEIEKSLTGCPYSKKYINLRLEDFDLNLFFAGIEKDDIIDTFFE